MSGPGRWSRWPWFYNKSNEPPVVYSPTPNGVPPLPPNSNVVPPVNNPRLPGVIIGADTSHTPQPAPPPEQQYGNTANLYPHEPSPIPQSISEPPELVNATPGGAMNMWAIILIVVVVLLVLIVLVGTQYLGN